MAPLTNEQFIERFDEHFKGLFKDGGEFGEAKRYACFGGGKRVRPLLVYLGALAVTDDVPMDAVLTLASALELIHSYSLVHDDLPAMDNDDMRRGRPTVHKKYGEANAILVGDALLTDALGLLIPYAAKFGDGYMQAAWSIACAASDMVVGQVSDLKGCASEREYLDMYANKTGALITAAASAGARVSGGSGEQIEKVAEYASMIGLAFQLADDLLDLGEDNSIVSVIGEERTRAMLAECTESAEKAAAGLNNFARLAQFAYDMCSRKK